MALRFPVGWKVLPSLKRKKESVKRLNAGHVLGQRVVSHAHILPCPLQVLRRVGK